MNNAFFRGTFIREKETPRMVRFNEDSDSPRIGTLYVSKLIAKNIQRFDMVLSLVEEQEKA